MTLAFENRAIALDQLHLHPANVRAASPETYSDENIAHLRAMIASLGLLEPLLVQKHGDGWGVLAGGRRLAALNSLAAMEDQSGHAFQFAPDGPIDCRVVPEGCDLIHAISLAENISQAEMTPIDQYEAFAKIMAEDGKSPEEIAMAFGTTVGAVKERLRYGRIHPEIRAAVRAKQTSLDAMKAFAGHPSQDVQLEIFEAMTKSGQHIAAWEVKKAIEARGLLSIDALGEFVFEAYQQADGAITKDLLAEHVVLEDMGLANRILEEKLQALAEEARAAGGFAWAEIMIPHDWQALHKYGRIYPKPLELDEKTKSRVEAITAELSDLEDKAEDEGLTDVEYQALNQKIEALTEEADALQEGYDPEEVKTAGVIVSWNNGVTITQGLVRPEDKAKPAGKEKDVDPGVITYAASFEADLKTERGLALGAALAQAPEVAADLALFKLVCDVLVPGASVTQAFDIRATRHHPGHAKLEEIDQTSMARMDAVEAGLSLDWADVHADPVAMFAAFRALAQDEKHRLVAATLARTVQPCFAREGHGESLVGAIEAEILPDIRTMWKPNAAFFARLKKAQLLAILTDLGLAEEAVNLAGSSKNEVVGFLDQLFTEPFATLTAEQRVAVDAWAPPGMQTPSVALALAPTPKAKKSGRARKAA